MQVTRPGHRLPCTGVSATVLSTLAGLIVGITLLAGQPVGPAQPGTTPSHSSTIWQGVQEVRLEVGGEGMFSNDVRIGDVTASGRIRRESWDVELQATRADIGIDYRNAEVADPLGSSASLHEARHALQGGVRLRPSRTTTLQVSGGGYDGYTDYRSLWLNEYYQQRFGPLEGYRVAQPRGWNASVGTRWAVRPGDRFLQGDLLWQQDVVAPAYEKFPFQPLIRRRDDLETRGVRLGGEAILGRRLRGLMESQVLWTTERRPRLSLRPTLHWAMAESWVLKASAGVTLERPRYASGSADVLLEHEWAEGWFGGLNGRYYHDNGQLNQSLPESTASPGLQTYQAAVVLRWQGDSWAFKALVGPYLNDYAAVPSRLNPFVHLYRDRSWIAAQVAVGRSF